MKVILSIEAVHPPLAGIGRYAWELATRLPKHAEIEDVRYMADGFWRNLPDLSTVAANSEPAISAPPVDLKTRLRRRLGRIPVLASLYQKIKPGITSSRLDGLAEGIFHGPNFFVPATHLPSVVTIHDLSIYRYPQWHPQARIERMRRDIPEAIERANAIITVSESVRQEVIREFNLPEQRVHAVLNGVDEAYRPYTAEQTLAVLSKVGLQHGGYSLFVSTVEPRKNLTNLLKAYRELPERERFRYPLVIAGGGGWQSREIHADIDRAQNEGWLKYLGFVDQAILPHLYAGSRLFVYPSWYEGFGIPIAEAMASGVPVLTSNCSSMPEVAAGAAILTEPADVDAIRLGLQQGLFDDAWRAQAVTQGLQRAAQLSWDKCVADTIKVYTTIY